MAVNSDLTIRTKDNYIVHSQYVFFLLKYPKKRSPWTQRASFLWRTDDASQSALIVLAARGGSVGRSRNENAPVHKVYGIAYYVISETEAASRPGFAIRIWSAD